MPTFAEISLQLDSQLKEVHEKKVTLDKATQAVSVASAEYNASLTKALNTRTSMEAELSKFLPNDAGRVRAA